MKALGLGLEGPVASRREVTGLMVDDVLERLVVTDRVYHDLKHSEPLVTELARRAWAIGARHVLIVAGNSLLAEVLRDAGLDVELRQPVGSILTDDLEELVSRRGSLDEVLRAESPGVRHDLVILPYVLDSTREHPVEVLSRLRRLVGPGGRVLAAHRPAGAIDSRLAGLAGRPILPDSYTDVARVSFSWPSLVRRRVFTARHLAAWCLESGFRVESQTPVISSRAAVAINEMNIGQWVGAQAAHGIKRLIPGLRDTMVAELTARSSSLEESTTGAKPRVTVVITASQSGRLERALHGLAEQSYPHRLLDVQVLLPQSVDAPASPDGLNVRFRKVPGPVGPADYNLALREAHGEVVAMTDDLCHLPREWVDLGVGGLTHWTTGLAGIVEAAAGSASPFLALPGARQTTRRDPWFTSFNSFYVAGSAREVGGFDLAMGDAVHGGRTGWDATLADRIVQDGLPVRVLPDLRVARLFPYPSAGGASRGRWLRQEFERAMQVPAAVRRMRRVGDRVLVGHLFASSRTAWFDLMLAGAVAAVVTRNVAWLLLVVPWLLAVRPYLPFWPPSQWPTSMRNLRGMVARHLVWLCGLIVGSAASRRVVL